MHNAHLQPSRELPVDLISIPTTSYHLALCRRSDPGRSVQSLYLASLLALAFRTLSPALSLSCSASPTTRHSSLVAAHHHYARKRRHVVRRQIYRAPASTSGFQGRRSIYRFCCSTASMRELSTELQPRHHGKGASRHCELAVGVKARWIGSLEGSDVWHALTGSNSCCGFCDVE